MWKHLRLHGSVLIANTLFFFFLESYSTIIRAVESTPAAILFVFAPVSQSEADLGERKWQFRMANYDLPTMNRKAKWLHPDTTHRSGYTKTTARIWQIYDITGIIGRPRAQIVPGQIAFRSSPGIINLINFAAGHISKDEVVFADSLKGVGHAHISNCATNRHLKYLFLSS